MKAFFKNILHIFFFDLEFSDIFAEKLRIYCGKGLLKKWYFLIHILFRRKSSIFFRQKQLSYILRNLTILVAIYRQILYNLVIKFFKLKI